MPEPTTTGSGNPCLAAKLCKCPKSIVLICVRFSWSAVDVEPEGADAVDVGLFSSISNLPVGCAGVVDGVSFSIELPIIAEASSAWDV